MTTQNQPSQLYYVADEWYPILSQKTWNRKRTNSRIWRWKMWGKKMDEFRFVEKNWRISAFCRICPKRHTCNMELTTIQKQNFPMCTFIVSWAGHIVLIFRPGAGQVPSPYSMFIKACKSWPWIVIVGRHNLRGKCTSWKLNIFRYGISSYFSEFVCAGYGSRRVRQHVDVSRVTETCPHMCRCEWVNWWWEVYNLL